MKTLKEYAKKGYIAFPVHGVSRVAGNSYCECGNPDCKAKRPYESWGHLKDADERRAEEWETKYPNCNIGMPTGSANGFWVLDIDAKSNGIETMKRIAGNNRFPDTPRAQTGGGGYHYFFKWDERAEELGISSNSGVFTGVDLKGEGGYIVAPPSKHMSGSSYNWITDAEIGKLDLKPMPDWLYEALKEAMHNDGKTKGKGERFKAQQVVEGDGRWQYLNDMACSHRAKYGYDAGMLFELLKMLQDSRCVFDAGKGEKPYPDSELERIAYDIEKKIEYVGRDLADQYTLDDYGNSLRFVNQHGSLVRWIPTGQKRSNGLWSVYDTVKWNTEPVAGVHVRTLGTQTIKAIPNEAETKTDKEQREATLKWGARCLDNRYLESMIERAKDNKNIVKGIDEFDTDDYALNTPNGTLRLGEDSITLEPHNPEDYITKVTKARYNPEAKAERWEQFLDEVFQGDKEKIQYIQKVLGYCLTGSTKDRLSWFLVGSGANGKSVLEEVIKEMMGDYGKKTNNKLLTGDGSTDQLALLTSLMDVRFTYCSELDEGRELSVAFFKEIVGGEVVEARRFYQDYIKFTPKCKIMLGTNNLPRIPEDSHAIWSRVRIITFPETFYSESELDAMERDGKDISGLKKRDDGLLDYLVEYELEGILNWCLEGYLLWRSEGLGDCESVRKATNNYRSDEDLLGEWIEECTESSVEYRELSRELLNSAKEYTGIDLHPKTFKRLMEKKGYVNQNKGGKKYYLGLRLSNKLRLRGSNLYADLADHI